MQAIRLLLVLTALFAAGCRSHSPAADANRQLVQATVLRFTHGAAADSVFGYTMYEDHFTAFVIRPDAFSGKEILVIVTGDLAKGRPTLTSGDKVAFPASAAELSSGVVNLDSASLVDG
jgi:hypothetical protein